jgi:hypothetical protein
LLALVKITTLKVNSHLLRALGMISSLDTGAVWLRLGRVHAESVVDVRVAGGVRREGDYKREGKLEEEMCIVLPCRRASCV